MYRRLEIKEKESPEELSLDSKLTRLRNPIQARRALIWAAKYGSDEERKTVREHVAKNFPHLTIGEEGKTLDQRIYERDRRLSGAFQALNKEEPKETEGFALSRGNQEGKDIGKKKEGFEDGFVKKQPKYDFKKGAPRDGSRPLGG